MDYAVVVALQILSGVAILTIVSLGLALVFGMMRVINRTHGEFLMLGGYAAILAYEYGCNFWLATLVVPPLVVGAIGAVVERLLIEWQDRAGKQYCSPAPLGQLQLAIT